MTIGPAPAVTFPAGNRAAPDPLSAYLTPISRCSLLTHGEEIELGRRVRAGDRLARRTLKEKNLHLVVSVAVRYRGSGVRLDDLIQEGNVGLIEAVERFDLERSHRFSYAVWRILKAIQQAAADQSRAIRVPRNAKDRLEALVRTRDELSAEVGREPGKKSRRAGWAGRWPKSGPSCAPPWTPRAWISRTASPTMLPPSPSSWPTGRRRRNRTRSCAGWSWTGYGGPWSYCRSVPPRGHAPLRSRRA